MISELAQGGLEVKHLCETLGVSRNAYYAWRQSPSNLHQQQDQRLQPMVQNIFLQHRRRYGARRITKELHDLGETCSRWKTRKIMDQMGLHAIQPRSFKPRTTQSKHTLGYSPNLLLQGIEITQMNQVWVGDITYIPLSNQFAYMATLMDLFSRKIIGWSLDLNMEEMLVIDTLSQAIKARQPTPNLIHHTDRGGQYASKKYRKILDRADMKQSMSRAGDCYDNAFMESCFGTVKTELEMTAYGSIKQANTEIREYINYYNALRRHSAIDYQSPTSFEDSHNH